MTADQDRRGFLKRAFVFVSAALVAVIGGPVTVAFLDPALRRRTTTMRDAKELARLSDLPVGDPVKMDVVSAKTDAWDRSDARVLGAVWLVRSRDDQVKAFSAVCPHLGCSVGFNTEKRVFACPCHESAFALEDGERIFGPSPRGLDPLPAEVKDQKVFITYTRFVQGIRARREA